MLSLDEDNIYSDSDSESEGPTLKRKSKTSNNKNKKRMKTSDDDVLPSLTKSKKVKNDLYKQPTVEELNQLRETENLFNSNIFRMQIDELLSEINIKPKHEKKFQNWFSTFKDCMNNIKEFADLTNQSGKKFQNVISKRLRNPLFKQPIDASMKFLKPHEIFQFDKFTRISERNKKLSANICVTIPKSCFYAKDYLNNKYFAKKYQYMYYLTIQIKSFDCVKKIEFVDYLGNNWMPILVITPDYSEKIFINLFVIPEVGTFKLNRCLPDRNNIKQNLFQKGHFLDLEVKKFGEIGTHLYNSVLLHDLTLQSNEEFFKNTLNDLENVKDGIKLLIVWLRQRNLNITYDGFTNDLLLNLIAHLITNRKLNKHMSSYQVVRIFWAFLSCLQENFISVCQDVQTEKLDIFTKHFEFTLLDASGFYNVAAFMHIDIFTKAKYEASIAMKSLDKNLFNTFSSLFITQMQDAVQYDAILKIHNDNNLNKIYKNCTPEYKFKYYGFDNLLLQNYILNYLKKGLTNRIKQIVPIYDKDNIKYGIIFDAEYCGNVVEKGPEQYEAAEFKEFWEHLCELRRFQDSSIREAVFFEDANSAQEKRLIFRRILKFVLGNKLQLKYTLNGDEMESLLKVPSQVKAGSNEEQTLTIKTVFFNLSTLLRELKLPLPIITVQGISNIFSYTEVYPEIALNNNKFKREHEINGVYLFLDSNEMEKLPILIKPIKCMMQFAPHSKWPKELKHLRAMKQLFLFEMCRVLRKEHDIHSLVREGCIDIYYEGFAFQIYLYHPNEISLLKENVTSDGVTYYKDNEESLKLETELNILPKIVGALNGLHQSNRSFGPSTCLIKRFIRWQLLNEAHISDVVINLLNAHLYVNVPPFNDATLPQVAFLRFLKFFSESDFNAFPVLVNFNDEMTNEEISEIETKFLQNRQCYNPLHIITPYDNGLSLFTKTNPSIHVLRRIKVLSQQAFDLITKNINSMSTINFKPLFIPNYGGFNLTIQLKEDVIPKRTYQVDGDNFITQENVKLPIIDFDPVEFYLNELQNNYGNYALFFHNPFAVNKIGVLWQENVMNEVDFKVSTVNAKKISKSKRLILNTDALLEDFYILGDGLVKTIHNKNKIV